jgi:hypothetical protein
LLAAERSGRIRPETTLSHGILILCRVIKDSYNMDLIRFLIDFILHIDVHLAELVASMASGFTPFCF